MSGGSIVYVAALSDVTVPTWKNCSPPSSASHVIDNKTLASISRISLEETTALRYENVVTPSSVHSLRSHATSSAAPFFISPGEVEKLPKHAQPNNRVQENKQTHGEKGLEPKWLPSSASLIRFPETTSTTSDTNSERCLAPSPVKDRKHEVSSSSRIASMEARRTSAEHSVAIKIAHLRWRANQNAMFTPRLFDMCAKTMVSTHFHCLTKRHL